jgi:hypothetical protein
MTVINRKRYPQIDMGIERKARRPHIEHLCKGGNRTGFAGISTRCGVRFAY